MHSAFMHDQLTVGGLVGGWAGGWIDRRLGGKASKSAEHIQAAGSRQVCGRKLVYMVCIQLPGRQAGG